MSKKPAIKIKIPWREGVIDGVMHWVGEGPHGISYRAAKFLNHPTLAEKYIVLREEPVPPSDVTVETDRLSAFLSADVKRFVQNDGITSPAIGPAKKYKVEVYSDFQKRIVSRDITLSKALHRHITDKDRFKLFAHSVYNTRAEVRAACELDLATVLNPEEITWYEYINGYTGKLFVGETHFMRTDKPLYALQINPDNAYTVKLLKEDWRTQIKLIKKSEKVGREAIDLCERDLIKRLSQERQIS